MIATGASYTLEAFVQNAFESSWFRLGKSHVEIDKSLLRPTDLSGGLGHPTKARMKLGWQAQYQIARCGSG